MSIDKDRARRICSRMKHLNLTVRETAQKLNVSPATVSAWRDGRAINCNKITILCDLLDMPETWLLRGDTPRLTTDEAFLIARYRELPDDLQDAVTKMVNSLYSYHAVTQLKTDDA